MSHENAARAATAAANSRATDSAAIAGAESSLAIAYALLDVAEAIRRLVDRDQVVAGLVADVARLRGVPERVVRLAHDPQPQPDQWAEDSPRSGGSR